MAGVTVQFLGSGDAFGSGGRFQACTLVRSGEASLLLDCGASSLIAMRRFNVDPNSIDTIVISHMHGDHFGGLPFFILDAQLVSHRERPLVIAGPPGLKERLQQTMEALFPSSSKVEQRFAIDIVELAEGTPTTIGTIEVTAHAVVHASGAPAYAIRAGCDDKVIAYSGDTEWTDELVRASAGADLFICEAYTFDKQVKFHLSYKTLAQHHGELDCKRLVLTHMSTSMLRRLAETDVEAAEDGKKIEL